VTDLIHGHVDIINEEVSGIDIGHRKHTRTPHRSRPSPSDVLN